MALDRGALRAYLDRPWGLFEQARDEAWGQETSTDGAARAISLSWHLREHLRELHPSWPTAEDRREDFAGHLHLKSLLDRAAPGIQENRDHARA